MADGAELIAAERRRQVEEEGWTAEHDDAHDDGELARAGAAYAAFSYALWPWDRSWWRPEPGDDIRRLVKAGALIVAEIDRLQRARGQGNNDDDK
jgi:hypothetical protein